MFKKYIQRRIEGLVKKYFKRHPEVKLIAVVGSVGKTTTKNIIATVLDEKFKVGGGFGNHNTDLSAPVALLGIKYPEKTRSVSEWLRVIRAAKVRVRQPAAVDVIVQELGIDNPGDMAVFERYLKPDITVVTAVTPEHMEFFKTMEVVAREELSAVNFSKQAVINRDDIPGEYAKYITNPNISTYGSSQVAENNFIIENFDIDKGFKGRFVGPKAPEKGIALEVAVYGEHLLRPIAAAVTVALELGLDEAQIVAGVSKVQPTPGRMNVLKGLRGARLIDDSYNSSPASAREALRSLYALDASQRIAVLGSMNELGDSSIAEHQALGELCNPNLLDWVITVGEQANQFLAPAAQAKGCQVKTFRHAIEAGAFVNKIMRHNSVVLFKGSQGDVYLEEAIKVVLASINDQANLVRQSPDWLARKNTFFSNFVNIPKGDD